MNTGQDDSKNIERIFSLVIPLLYRNDQFNSAIAIASSIQDTETRIRAFERLASVCANDGEVDLIEQIQFAFGNQSNSIEFDLAKAFARRGDVEKANDLAKPLSPQDRNAVLVEIAKYWILQDNEVKAIESLNAVEEDVNSLYRIFEPEQPSDYRKFWRIKADCEIALCLAQKNMKERALFWLSKVDQEGSIESPYLQAQALLSKASSQSVMDRDKAVETYRNAIEIGAKIEDVLHLGIDTKQFQTFYELGKSLTENGFLEETLNLTKGFNKFPDEKWRLIEVVFISFVALESARLDDSTSGIKLFSEALKRAKVLENSFIHIYQWQVVALNIVANLLVEAGFYKTAFRTISEATPSEEAFITMVAGWTNPKIHIELITGITEIFSWNSLQWSQFKLRLVRET